jgi:hypothetical protein
MEKTDTAPTWVVIRTFNRKEMEVSSFLTKNHLHHFIPMFYAEKFKKGEEKPHKVLVPVVRNYIFLEKNLGDNELRTKLSECDSPLILMTDKSSGKLSEISDREMMEFRLLCDPDYSKTPKEFVETDDSKAIPGKDVMVVHGQFAGIRGRLLKKNQKYWFVKTVGGISVMLRISRWYCKVL